MKNILEFFQLRYKDESKRYTQGSFIIGAVTYGLLFLLLNFIAVSSEYARIQPFWAWVTCVLFAGNLIGRFVFERVRLFAVFAYLGGVVIIPLGLFLTCIPLGEGLSGYLRLLGWLAVIVGLTLVWQIVVFFCRGFVERIESKKVQNYIVFMPMFLCCFAVIAVVFIGSGTFDFLGVRRFDEKADWLGSVILLLVGGAAGGFVVIGQFFRLCAFIRGDRPRYGGVFDGFTPGGPKPAGLGVEDDSGLGGRVLGGGFSEKCVGVF